MTERRRVRYTVTFEVPAREDGADWDPDALRRKLSGTLWSVGPVSLWDAHESRASIDFRRATKIRVKRVEVDDREGA